MSEREQIEQDVKLLREAAAKATQGTRMVLADTFVKLEGCFDYLCTMQVSNQPNFRNDAMFIAAADRDRITRILDEVERLRAENTVQQKALEMAVHDQRNIWSTREEPFYIQDADETTVPNYIEQAKLYLSALPTPPAQEAQS